MLKNSYLNSSFSDRYKGVFFKITFYAYPNGWVTELEIDGRPPIADKDKTWPTKDEAKAAAEKIAHQIVDHDQVSPALS
ncbi:hypothetical protein K3F44_08945 [Pseudomonas sp. S07E 245]|uniref:hypothetical protein n=1 Tax=Pseudomonas sp. S07E 245 TaxID=2866278 RepID=UPI001C73C9ED|nr:hypothetical protein [Pseudomonas sp. S07E 245]QYX54399.1 hypothetical protein K3F44_08945 [Pseudomonas sp. S07E 245]